MTVNGCCCLWDRYLISDTDYHKASRPKILSSTQKVCISASSQKFMERTHVYCSLYHSTFLTGYRNGDTSTINYQKFVKSFYCNTTSTYMFAMRFRWKPGVTQFHRNLSRLELRLGWRFGKGKITFKIHEYGPFKRDLTCGLAKCSLIDIFRRFGLTCSVLTHSISGWLLRNVKSYLEITSLYDFIINYFCS